MLKNWKLIYKILISSTLKPMGSSILKLYHRKYQTTKRSQGSKEQIIVLLFYTATILSK